MKLFKMMTLFLGCSMGTAGLACISPVTEASIFTINLPQASSVIEGKTGDFFKFTIWAEGSNQLTQDEIDDINARKTPIISRLTFLEQVKDPTSVIPQVDLFNVESLKVEQTSFVISADGDLGREVFRQAYTIILSASKMGSNAWLTGSLYISLKTPNGSQSMEQLLKLFDAPIAKNLYNCGG